MQTKSLHTHTVSNEHIIYHMKTGYGN